MKNILIAAALVFVCAASGLAQAKPKFSSVYTNLTTNCKDFDGENGSDGYSICRGPGGYRIRNWYAAAATLFGAELKGDDSANYAFPMLDLKFDRRKTKVEWRTANGKPFAVIMRIPTYAEPRNDNEYFGPVNGERLFIRGLKGFDFETEVDVKTPSPNAKARELADAAYLKIKGN